MAHLRRVSLREVAWRVQEYHRPTGPGTHIFLDKSVKTMHTLHPMAKFRTQSASSDPVSSFRGGSRPAEAPGDGGCREIGNLRRGAHLGGRRSGGGGGGGRPDGRSAGRTARLSDGVHANFRTRVFCSRSSPVCGPQSIRVVSNPEILGETLHGEVRAKTTEFPLFFISPPPPSRINPRKQELKTKLMN